MEEPRQFLNIPFSFDRQNPFIYCSVCHKYHAGNPCAKRQDIFKIVTDFKKQNPQYSIQFEVELAPERHL